MQNGDLLSYIRDEKNNPTVKNLLIFAIEIAKGLSLKNCYSVSIGLSND